MNNRAMPITLVMVGIAHPRLEVHALIESAAIKDQATKNEFVYTNRKRSIILDCVVLIPNHA